MRTDPMTHRLLLIRHAKSSWSEPSLPDRERPLNHRGHAAAERLGRHLRNQTLLPDLILCSPARRTRETLERLGLGDVKVRADDALYGADDDEIMTIVRTVAEGVATVAVVGHNPAMQDLAIALARQDPAAARLREKFPTGALAEFEVEGTWSDLAPGTAHLRAFVVPRELV